MQKQLPLRGSVRPAYVNPLEEANVTGERVDQGVDYAGSGVVNALAGGVITDAKQSDPGWEGSYLEYQVTQPGPLQGQRIYVAEGFSIAQGIKVGDTVQAGDMLGTIVKGSSTGIETGFGSGNGELTYANQHGGYSSADSANDTPTAAGEAFSTLIHDLGGPSGRATSTNAIGSAPPAVAAAIKSNTAPFGPTGAASIPVLGGPIQAGESVVNAVGSAVSAGESFANFLSNPVPVLLTIALVVLGGGLIYTGVRRMLGTDNADSQPKAEGSRLFVIPGGGKSGASKAESIEELGALA